MTLESATGPVVVDLGDFVPEEQQIRFSIAGNAYVVAFSEATVDEVFAMIASEPDGGNPAGRIAKHRTIVSRFLCAHVSKGDAKQLAGDLKLLPFTTAQGKLSISDLYDRIQLRVKKNPMPGE